MLEKLKKLEWKPLILSFVFTLGTGFLSSVLTKGSMDKYMDLKRPPLSPPGWVFGVVWPVLFILMAISAYIVYTSDATEKDKRNALFLYGLQLFVNFFWTIIYFNLEMRVFAFIWLILLIIIVVFMIMDFVKIDKVAGYLQIPYLIWLIFAAYLNLGTIILN